MNSLIEATTFIPLPLQQFHSRARVIVQHPLCEVKIAKTPLLPRLLSVPPFCGALWGIFPEDNGNTMNSLAVVGMFKQHG